MVDKFDDMDLKEDLLRGIYAYGFVRYSLLIDALLFSFEKPSAIQQRAIMPCIKGIPLVGPG